MITRYYEIYGTWRRFLAENLHQIGAFFFQLAVVDTVASRRFCMQSIYKHTSNTEQLKYRKIEREHSKSESTQIVHMRIKCRGPLSHTIQNIHPCFTIFLFGSILFRFSNKFRYLSLSNIACISSHHTIHPKHTQNKKRELIVLIFFVWLCWHDIERGLVDWIVQLK